MQQGAAPCFLIGRVFLPAPRCIWPCNHILRGLAGSASRQTVDDGANHRPTRPFREAIDSSLWCKFVDNPRTRLTGLL